MKHILIVALGFIIIAGATGNQDFYDECRAAADCVAGDPPSLALMIVQYVIGLVIMLVGLLGAKGEER